MLIRVSGFGLFRVQVTIFSFQVSGFGGLGMFRVSGFGLNPARQVRKTVKVVDVEDCETPPVLDLRPHWRRVVRSILHLILGLGFWVFCFVFGVWGLGLGVWGLGLGVSDFGFRVSDFVFRVSCLGF